MDAELKRQLTEEFERGGRSYVRNLVAAEQAVIEGRFNLAKVLRAMAQTQRVLAMEAARQLQPSLSESDILTSILTDIDASRFPIIHVADDLNLASSVKRAAAIHIQMRDIVERARLSLQHHPDVLESDVAQVLWVCYDCGAIYETERPQTCPICGAPNTAFEWYGPFYVTSAEHLGELSPDEILTILERIPTEVEEALEGIDEATLHGTPSTDEWSIAEIVGHMIETDIVFAMRVHVLLEAQGAQLMPSVPPWKLQEGKGYETMSTSELIARLRDSRAKSVNLVQGLTPQDWSRQDFIDGGRRTMSDLGTWIANHDRGHLAQIKRLRESQSIR